MKSQKLSAISDKYPTYRDAPGKSSYLWLDGKRVDDRAEGLWRIHDNLYDLTEFIDRHPGGPDWLRLTKGTDITEAFEAHHLTPNPEAILPKYKVRAAKEPRLYKFTFKEDGFYRTLRNRVIAELPKLNYGPVQTSKLVVDMLLVSIFISAPLTVRFQSYAFAFLTGLLITWAVVAAHNYIHRRDNWRMFVFNLSLFSYREWRVSHAMSHHIYPNSLHDLEISMFEPFMSWIPDARFKNNLQRYASWIYGPLVYALLYMGECFKRICLALFTDKKVFSKDDLVPLIVPLVMYFFGNQDVSTVLKYWLVTMMMASFIFGLIGLNAAHHHPDVTHEGDALREGLDWGIYQLDTVMDRADLRGSHFLVLTHFGEHSLHHLFPTLDHGILPQLNDIFIKTCKEFEADLTACSWFHHIVGQHKQLARITTNPTPRGLSKSK